MNLIQNIYNFIAGEDYSMIGNTARTLVFMGSLVVIFYLGWWLSIVATDLRKEINKRLKTGENK